MENEKRNQFIVVGIITLLLFIVISFIIYTILGDRKGKDDMISIKFNQIYSSDYKLTYLDDNYFIGSYSKEKVNNKINVIIDENGTEIVKCLDDIVYDNIFKINDDKYLIYNNLNNNLNLYVFDGKELVLYKVIENINYVKPILYKDENKEYIVAFASLVDGNLCIYNIVDDSTTILENKSLVGDYSTEGIYYTYNDKYLVVKDNEGLMGVVDLKGNQIVDYKYKNIINTNNNAFIVVSVKDKYGIIDENNNVLVKLNYDVIDRFDDYFLVVSKKTMALFDKNYNNLTGFKMNYDGLLEYDLRKSVNSINLYKIKDMIFIVNNNKELNNGTEYEKHNLYVVKDGKIKNNVLQVSFDYTNIIYTFDKEHMLKIYDNEFNLILEYKSDDMSKILNVRMIRNGLFEFRYCDDKDQEVILYLDKNGNIVDANYGNVKIIEKDYFVSLDDFGSSKKIVIYDKNGEKMDEMVGENISISYDFVIIDNAIYKILVS